MSVAGTWVVMPTAAILRGNVCVGAGRLGGHGGTPDSSWSRGTFGILASLWILESMGFAEDWEILRALG